MAALSSFGGTVSHTGTIVRCYRKVSVRGESYYYFVLRSGEREVHCFAWEGKFSGQTPALHSQVHVSGHREQFNGFVSVRVRCIAPAVPPTAVDERNLGRLRLLYQSCSSALLQDLLRRLVQDEAIWSRWAIWQASRTHHHAYKGGLLHHSLEAAMWVLEHLDLPLPQRELAAMAALLHDIGKILTLDAEGNATPLGMVLHHELLTLRVLANHLHWLEQQDQDLAVELQRMLVVRQNLRSVSRYDLPLSDEMVFLADKRSALLPS